MLHGLGIAPTLIHFLHTYRLGGLFLLLLIEEAGVPIPLPGDMLVALAGAQPHLDAFYAFRVLTASTLAVFLGSSVLFWVIRQGGRPLVLRLGRYARVNPQRLDQMERWFAQRGALAIVVGRLIPGLRVPTTVMAGLTNVPYRVYAPADALSALIWSVFFFYLGRLVQPYLGVVTAFGLGLFDSAEDSLLLTLILITLVTLAIVGGWRLYQRRRSPAHAAPLAALAGLDANEAPPLTEPAETPEVEPETGAVGNVS